MAKVLRCRDLGMDCPKEMRAENEEELLKVAAAHAEHVQVAAVGYLRIGGRGGDGGDFFVVVNLGGGDGAGGVVVAVDDHHVERRFASRSNSNRTKSPMPRARNSSASAVPRPSSTSIERPSRHARKSRLKAPKEK